MIPTTTSEVNFDHEHLYLKELKFALERPRLYLVKHFEDLRNRIDIKCLGLVDEQTELIKQVELFEAECLNQHRSNQLEESVDRFIRSEIKKIEEELTLLDSVKATLAGKERISRLIDEAMYELQKVLFVNKTLVYLEDETVEYPVFCISPIGSIIIVEDEFISHKKFLMNLYLQIFFLTA